MKITVYLNDRMTEALMLACGKDRRYPRQQAEHLLEQVLCGPGLCSSEAEGETRVDGEEQADVAGSGTHR